MIWPCKQNALGKTPQTSFTCRKQMGKTIERPKTRWTDYIEDLGWNRLGLYPSKIMEGMEDSEMWWRNLELLPPATLTAKRAMKKEEED